MYFAIENRGPLSVQFFAGFDGCFHFDWKVFPHLAVVSNKGPFCTVVRILQFICMC